MFKKVSQKLIYSGILACPWVMLPAASAEEIPSSIQSNAPEVLKSLENNSTENYNDTMEQITNVSQLRDVQPTDWAYEALRSVVERYGCIAGYPDGTFRGNRALTRYEFAAGLNACLQQVERLIGASTSTTSTTANSVAQEDLERLRRLQEEFRTELATLGTRVDNLESRAAFIEQRQFSTTTKLNGEVAFFVSSLLNNPNRPDSVIDREGAFEEQGGPFGKNATFSDRIRLDLNSSFTGRDQLKVRLRASNVQRWAQPTALDQNIFTTPVLPAFATNVGRLHGEAITTSPPYLLNNNNVHLDLLSYSFPFTDRGNIKVIAHGGRLDEFAPTLNPLDYGDAALGSISEFGQRNPIYRLSGRGAGAGIDYKLSDAVRLSLGYLGGNSVYADGTSSPGSPSGGTYFASRFSSGAPGPGGIFNGTFGAIAQLTLTPVRNFNLGLTYVRSYFSPADVYNASPGLDGGVGSHFAEIPLGGGPMEINSYGVETSYRLSPKFIVGGWVGVEYVYAPIGGTNPFQQVVSPPDSRATILNFALTLAFPDLFKEGSLGGIVIGQSPKNTYSDGRLPPQFAKPGVNEQNNRLIDGEDSYHIEAFYRYPINSNISLTPGFIAITNPEYDARNKTIMLGTLRMTFTF